MKFIDKVKKNKLLYFLGVLIIGVFIILIVRFTYAYLALNVNEARENVTLSSDETDNLDFVLGDPLSIDATPTTLPENGENLTDTTTATAVLLANSTNETANYSYWVYFTISSNTFIYSDGSTPEIILTVTDPEGNPVTNIDGLTYGTYNGVAGFDVTTEYGVFTVASDYAITANSSTTATEQTWTFTLTYLNQNYDQSINYGNNMTTEISMTKEEAYPTLADYIISNVYTGVDGDNGLYYHDGSMISDTQYCLYDGVQVHTSELSTFSTSAEDCQNIYESGGYYYDASIVSYGLERGVIEPILWNSSEGTCQTESGLPVYEGNEFNVGDSVIQDDCNGYAIIDSSVAYIMNRLGSGYIGYATYDAGDNSYRYAGGDYLLTSKATDAGYISIATNSREETTGLINFYCNDSKSYVGAFCASYNTSHYTTAYDESVQYESYQEALDRVVADGYLTSNNIHNYVCFGSTESTCPEDNLYRIIGIFDDDNDGIYNVKLIKAEFATNNLLGTDGEYYYASTKSFYWNNKNFTNSYNETGYYNVWSYSELNTINLNTNYLNTFEDIWQNKISSHTWIVGGLDLYNAILFNNHTTYYFEINNPNNDTETTYNAKIGLMYLSDYQYAMTPNSWSSQLLAYNDESRNNWMYLHDAEWTISRETLNSAVYIVTSYDEGMNMGSSTGGYAGVRPVFYLKSNVKLAGGTGTSTVPYRITLDTTNE